jgi:serine protease Do
MRKYILTSITLLPFLLTCSYADQTWGDRSTQSSIFWGDEGGTNSYLGVDIDDVTTERLSALKLKEEKGAEVTMVDQDAPAGKAGIREHDVILTMNGTPIESAAQLRRMIHETPAGRIIELGLSRDGAPLTIKLQLADRHKEFSMGNMKDFHVEVPEIHIAPMEIPRVTVVTAMTSMRSGLMIENMTSQLGEFFGVKNGNGVLVRNVEKGSRADKAGFRAGDVIVKINEQPVHDTGDFTHAVRSHNGGTISVSVMRDRKEQNLNLSLPESKDSGDLFMNESFEDLPRLNAEGTMEFSELRNQIAQLHPQMELATQQAVENARKAAAEVRKSFDQEQRKVRQDCADQREKYREAEKHLRKSMEEMSRHLRQGLEL